MVMFSLFIERAKKRNFYNYNFYEKSEVLANNIYGFYKLNG